MSKAVLVIDMPKRCKDCFRYRADAWFGGRCTQAKEDDGWDKTIEADEEYNVQNWCPLQMLDNQPTEKAIPVEWIEKYKRVRGWEATVTTQNAIDNMLNAWEKENETNQQR